MPERMFLKSFKNVKASYIDYFKTACLLWEYSDGGRLSKVVKILWSLSGVWKTFRLPICDKNSVQISKLSNAYLKNNEITMDMFG